LALRNKRITAPLVPEDLVGLISQHASPRDIALQTISDAAYICTRTHGDAPEVTIHGRTDLTFPYITSHLHYILLELLKNSMRATVEKHGTDNMPPIRIVIADGEDNEDVSVIFNSLFWSDCVCHCRW
jgi:pyruvate dehydrogenase kinase 2/3/4